MVGNDGAATLYAVALRATRLAADGTTPAGASNSYVTNTLVKLTFTPVYEAGDEVNKKDGQGRLCLAVKAPDVFKRIDINDLEICAFDPELSEILAGGAIITDTGATVGYASPHIGTDPVPNGVSLEVWTRRYVDSAPAALPYAHYVFPKVKLKPKQKSIEAASMVVDFEGEAFENPSWGNGPDNLWLSASDRAMQWIAVATAPTGAVGYTATPAQTP